MHRPTEPDPAFTSNPDVLLIVDRKDGRIRMVNSSFEIMFACARAEMVGRILPETGLCTTAADDARIHQALTGDHCAGDFY